MLGGRTHLHVFQRNTVTAVKYRDKVLEPYVRLFRSTVDPDFILMDGNERPHRVRMVDEFLESEYIRRMGRPARSPEFSPIEDAWDTPGRAIITRYRPSRILKGLKTAMLKEYN
ncbi:transposable element Tcb2 transposase [Trichonephila clavipes]|nr:transposable element Tcb2 transposase [Trichonephila clavipes]